MADLIQHASQLHYSVSSHFYGAGSGSHLVSEFSDDFPHMPNQSTTFPSNSAKSAPPSVHVDSAGGCAPVVRDPQSAISSPSEGQTSPSTPAVNVKPEWRDARLAATQDARIWKPRSAALLGSERIGATGRSAGLCCRYRIWRAQSRHGDFGGFRAIDWTQVFWSQLWAPGELVSLNDSTWPES